VIRALTRLGLVALVLAIVLAGWATWRILDAAGRDDPGPAGAVVVLGAAQYDGRPSPVFAARIEHAVALWREGAAPFLVVTGGKQAGDRTTEAATARAYALERGVPEASILVEDEGRTTVESLRAVARILDARGISDAVFVSDPTHIFRVLLIAADEGIAGHGSPTRTSPIEADPIRRLDAILHELGALAHYFLLVRTGLGVP
jgi:uncharacterized SAM-binding protein YcdF (DUF218 family)